MLLVFVAEVLHRRQGAKNGFLLLATGQVHLDADRRGVITHLYSYPIAAPVFGDDPMIEKLVVSCERTRDAAEIDAYGSVWTEVSPRIGARTRRRIGRDGDALGRSHSGPLVRRILRYLRPGVARGWQQNGADGDQFRYA